MKLIEQYHEDRVTQSLLLKLLKIVVETRDDDYDDSDYHSTLPIPSVDPCLFFAGAKGPRKSFTFF
ncbi:hypothetical protein ABEB36_004906 [Hypothenemus hampei]|uniref:Uncharacterized protein n=1 Tax=Hypothenemus hampei TaxID=57062 RepID=A0ABD1EW96_HYPHA